MYTKFRQVRQEEDEIFQYDKIITSRQERIAVAKEREQAAKLQTTLEDQIEKLEGCIAACTQFNTHTHTHTHTHTYTHSRTHTA